MDYTRQHLTEQGLVEGAAQHWDEEAEAAQNRQRRATDMQRAQAVAGTHEAAEIAPDGEAGSTGNGTEEGHGRMAPVRLALERDLLPQAQNRAAEMRLVLDQLAIDH